ncbi:hypothetical protein QVD17_26098 [Tagetes erecta]|uniref:Protein kinase domain-containing protein n=1 Tax=Tagetes erecta TaxID=13708 RepID=A0AAD8K8B0_TARER|nr:hypothetical protein QVD17_26098 [Tagetes erecta]
MSFHTTQAVESSSYPPHPCRQFTFSEIEAATKNFDDSLVIGRGGFGKVYRGTITYGETLLDAAIKRLESGSNQGAVEFWAEIEMLSNLRHIHLVSLIGYCNEGQEMVLVYEYISNGTLADRLHKTRAPLTWVRRLKICIGAARGIEYLHSDIGTKPRVIHRDVKSSNILLAFDWTAKISDFGLSKIRPMNQPSTYVNTLVRGTFGYLDPDYYQTGRLTRKSDVYAFGVVLFEVLSGKQAVDRSIDEEHWGLATWAQDSIKEGKLKQIVDSNIRERMSPKCLKEFALLADRCLHSRPKQRPTMAEVVVGLESILALQEKTDNTLLVKLFGKRVPTIRIPFNWDNSVEGTRLNALDVYMYTVVGEDRIIHRFDFNTIVYATENFSKANQLSHARYGYMYKGRLQNGQHITITKYSNAIMRGNAYKECMNEASVLVKFEHENVIQLLGYCINGTDVYLLYAFTPIATLNGLLFDPMCNLLDWNKRYKIILGVARVLVYLHNHAPIRIIHRDVIPVNILLDESFNIKFSGFGLAMTFDDETDCIDVDQICGTLGYLAPEYTATLRLSTKSDVYSFGVLVLETVTGQRAYDCTRAATHHEDEWLNFYVHRNLKEGRLSDIIDPRIDVDSILMTNFVEIGLLCVQENAEVRPTMEEVIGMLLGTVSLTLPVLEMRARMNAELYDSPTYLDGQISEVHDTSAVEEFVSEYSH